MDSGIFRRENEGGQEAEEESAMPMSELPRDFLIKPQPTEADFQIPDDAERLTRPKKPQTIKKIGEIISKIETNPNATQYLLLTDVSVSLRKYLLNERIHGLRFTFDDRKILLRIMPSGQHECVIGQFILSFGDAMTAAGLPSSGER
ncbi:hypothetical protein CBS147332_2129 [Penicillium roqueforti]|nr:hypothetical protein CBS147332_2129 [Penicillium roqueforti]KAI3107038.1 hypothetical protein CBS147331_6344 [Penicillium roqueforti]